MYDLKKSKQISNNFDLNVHIWPHMLHMVEALFPAGLEPCFHAVQNTLKRTARPVKGIWVPGRSEFGNAVMKTRELEAMKSTLVLFVYLYVAWGDVM